MPYIIIIDKLGNVKETNIKEYKESDLFKKVNFKSPEGFDLQTQWKTSVAGDASKIPVVISLYAKKTGKAGQENKYEFPPPVATVLYFGGCVLVCESAETGKVRDLRISEWNHIYEKLMGGFFDLTGGDSEEEEDEEDEDELGEDIKLDKNGYKTDDFVVEDDEVDYDNLSVEEEEEIDDDLESSESEEEIVVKKKTNKKTKETKPKKNKKVSNDLVLENISNSYLDCSVELTEEDYFE